MIKYLVVGNIGAHSGHIQKFNTEDLTPQGSLTYQDLLGSHGTDLGEFDTPEEANKCLLEFLTDCPGKNGGYCYTHNPEGR